MKNKIIAFLISAVLIASGTVVSFADGSEISIYNKKYYGDYTAETNVNSTVFDPNVNIDVMLNDVSWLGITADKPRQSTIKFKFDAKEIDLNKELPNLKKFAIRQNMVQGSLVGYTFACSNIGGSWNLTDGSWTVSYGDPKAKIRTALQALKDQGYIKTAWDSNTYDEELEQFWYDNKLHIANKAKFQIGNDVVSINSSDGCDIDDFYNTMDYKDRMEKGNKSFAYCMNREIKEKSVYGSSSDNRIYLLLPKNSYLTVAHTRIQVLKELEIEIKTSNFTPTGSLRTLYNAIVTSEAEIVDYDKDTGEPIYSKWADGNKCDVDAVFHGVFSVVNDVIGALAEADANIVIGKGTPAEVTEDITTSKTVCAEINVKAGCKHTKTVVKDKVSPTVIAPGWTGETYCANCGILLSEGELISKLPSYIKLNYDNLKLKVGQSTSAVKVSFKKGDKIKSVKSSNEKIVKAAKSGSKGIKLTAGKKTGTATVTVKLAGGKSKVITVKVQKSEVACTGMTVSSGTSVKIKKGKTHQIKVTRKPVTCVQKITYKSANKKIATVTSKGKIKGVKKGTTKITVKCGKKSKTIKVTVK